MATNLGDLVVVGQEHGQILRLLDGRRLRHFPEELGGSDRQGAGFKTLDHCAGLLLPPSV